MTGGQFANLNLLKFDELFPRSLSEQELSHTRHGVDRYPRRAHRFPPKMQQAGVVAHMGMREQDPIESW